jgi:hypothetical protein
VAGCFDLMHILISLRCADASCIDNKRNQLRDKWKEGKIMFYHTSWNKHRPFHKYPIVRCHITQIVTQVVKTEEFRMWWVLQRHRRACIVCPLEMGKIQLPCIGQASERRHESRVSSCRSPRYDKRRVTNFMLRPFIARENVSITVSTELRAGRHGIENRLIFSGQALYR